MQVCTNCATLIRERADACPRCGQRLTSIEPGIELEMPPLHCAARLHYVPSGADVCECGTFRHIVNKLVVVKGGQDGA